MGNERPVIHAYLTHEAREAWHQFCDGHGISTSGLVEAIGLHLLNNPDFAEAETLAEHARRIDVVRRRRGPGRKAR